MLRGIRSDLNITTVRLFLPLAPSRPGPTLSTVNLPTLANENEQPGLAGASDGQSMLATSVAYFNLLLRTAAPLLSGEQTERAAFSPLAWSQCNLRLT